LPDCLIACSAIPVNLDESLQTASFDRCISNKIGKSTDALTGRPRSRSFNPFEWWPARSKREIDFEAPDDVGPNKNREA
jgi:hypothetical protein